MNKDGIKEYAAIAIFVLLAIVAGGGIGGKPPEDLQMARVIDDADLEAHAAPEGDAHAKGEHADADGHAKGEGEGDKPEEKPAVEMVTLELDDLDTAIDATGYSPWGEQTVLFNPTSGSFTHPEGAYEGGKIEGTIDMDLMIHDKQLLIDHIQEESFFNTAEYPEATFESSSIKKTAEGYEIIGKLTIKGKSKAIALNAQINETDSHVVIESRNTGIKTTWWDLKYKGVKEDIKLDIELLFKKS